MFGRPRGHGSEEPVALELVRLAFPRRVYTQSHLDYVAEALNYLADRAEHLPGVHIVWQAPTLRHFTARFALL